MSKKFKEVKRGIIWFRNDLRITDNQVLHHAAKECDEVIPLYIFDREYLHREEFGSHKFGSKRVNFLLESLHDLKKSLKSIGGNLVVEVGKPEEVIEKLAAENDADSLYAHKEVTSEEIEQEEAVKKAMKPFGYCHFFYGHSLFHPEDIPFELENIPDVFSNFRKKCEKYAEVRPLFPIPGKIGIPENVEAAQIPSLSELGFSEETISEKAAIEFHGGEREARKRLEKYFWETENLSKYKYTRNGLLGEGYSSKFSAWLSCGCISPRMIYSEVKRYEKSVKKNVSTYWMIFELIWRDYFRYVAMKYGNRLFFSRGIKDEETDWTVDEEKLEAWKHGETGVPFIDANMRELNETGFMSNRGRQNVASYLVKDLKQDWRYGAAYFEEKLIDYDVTSNWGNWAYVSGVGNDPRQNRYFNVLSQAKRYDEKGEFVKHWLPKLGSVDKEFVHQPWKMGEKEKSASGIKDTRYEKPVYANPKW